MILLLSTGRVSGPTGYELSLPNLRKMASILPVSSSLEHQSYQSGVINPSFLPLSTNVVHPCIGSAPSQMNHFISRIKLF